MILREIKNIYIPVQQIEYLESTGTQYIDTEVYANLDTSVDVKFCFTEIFQDNAIISSDMGSSEFNSFTLEYYYDPIIPWGQYGIVFSIDGHSAIAYKGTTERALEWFEVNASNHGLVINNVFYSSRQHPSNFTLNYPLFMFAYGRNGVPIIFGKSRITYLKIYNNGTLIRDFIPVRVGSVGYMYDRVSERLFGNKGTGDFVLGQDVDSGLQQIYQNRMIEGVDFKRYEWLKGDGIINYDKPINYLSDNLRIKIRNLDSNSGYNTIWVGGETNPGENDWRRCIIDFEFANGVSARQVQWCEYVYRDGYYQHFPLSSDNIYTFDININRAIINGVTYSMTSSRCNVTTPFVITLRKADSIAYCKLNNVDMYPCQLLRPIPRNLDAQCKERVAGECGMVDLISGKFYGNVASSGTFTVENNTNE